MLPLQKTTATRHIVLIEPDPHVRAMLGEYLRGKGYEIVAAMEINALWAMIGVAAIDVLVVNPAGIIQSASASRRRATLPELPVIALGGLDEDVNRISRLGFQPCTRLPNPVHPRKLLASIRLVLSTAQIESGTLNEEHARVFRFANWVLDTDSQQLVSGEGKTVRLGKAEYRVLKALLVFPNLVISREQLIEAAFRTNKVVSARWLETTIHRLRCHLGDDARFPEILQTIRGVGYKFVAPVEKVSRHQMENQ